MEKPKRWTWEEYYEQNIGEELIEFPMHEQEAFHANEPLIEWLEASVKEQGAYISKWSQRDNTSSETIEKLESRIADLLKCGTPKWKTLYVAACKQINILEETAKKNSDMATKNFDLYLGEKDKGGSRIKELEEEIERHMSTERLHAKRFQKRMKTIATLREALEFYANPDNWIDEQVKLEGFRHEIPILIHTEQLNSGAVARTALHKAFGENDDQI